MLKSLITLLLLTAICFSNAEAQYIYVSSQLETEGTKTSSYTVLYPEDILVSFLHTPGQDGFLHYPLTYASRIQVFVNNVLQFSSGSNLSVILSWSCTLNNVQPSSVVKVQLDFALTVPQSSPEPPATIVVTSQHTYFTPQNLTVGASYNHPYLHWNASTLPNLAHYEIWKQKNGTWTLKATTTNTNYTDVGELIVAPSTTVYYKVCAVNGDNQKTDYSNVVGIGVWGGPMKMIPNSKDSVQFLEIPTSLQVMQNYPNPFNPSTTISFSLSNADYVLLQVFDITGRLVSTLIDGYIEAGNNNVDFNAQQLSSGIYFYKITTTKNTIVKRMLLLK